MSPSVIKPVQEETASASSTRRVAQLLDRISLILFPIAFVARLAVDEQLDAWHIFCMGFPLNPLAPEIEDYPQERNVVKRWDTGPSQERLAFIRVSLD